MATVAELIAKLGLDTSDFNKGIAESQNKAKGLKDGLENAFKKPVGAINQLKERIRNLQRNLESATDIKSIAKYNIRLDQAKTELQQLGTVGLVSANSIAKVSSSMNTLGASVQKVAKAQSNYNGIGIEFSRIIQDAPFGIIGIGNNIQQLAANFQQLRASSTSTGAALKTALASIISPANLLVLGISVLTSAFTYLQMNGFFKTKESAEDADEALEKYRESLDAVRKTTIEGRAAAEREIQDFRLLRAQAENANIPLATRIEAVKELQKSYPNYLGNLTQEQILTGKVGTAYQDLTKELIATAKARAASDRIAENSLKLLTLEEQLQRNVDEQKRLGLITSQKAVQISGTGLSVATQEDIAQKKIKKLQEEQLAILEQILPIKEEDSKLTQTITDLVGQGAKFTETEIDDLGEKNVKRNEELKILRDINKEFLKNTRINPRNPFSLDEDPKRIAQLKEIDKITKALISPQLANLGIIIPQDSIDRIKQANEGLNETNTSLSAVTSIAGMLGNTFQSAFEGMLNSGKVSFRGIIEGLKALIIKLIAAAAAAFALNILLGGIGISKGAFGGIEGFKQLFSGMAGIPKFAKGGMVTGLTTAVLGDNPSGKEAIIPFEKMGSFLSKYGTGGGDLRVEVVGVTRGEDIYWSGFNYSNNRNKIIGG